MRNPSAIDITVVTDRGQVSIPAHLRRELSLDKGKRLVWEKVGDHELDIFEGNPGFATSAADLFARHAEEGLVICPMTYMELAPAFEGDRDLQDEFLGGVGAAYHESWGWEDTLQAHAAWHSAAEGQPYAGLAASFFWRSGVAQ
jgi:hypothetical protein